MKISKVDFKTSAMLNNNVSALLNIDAILPFNYNQAIKTTNNKRINIFKNNF